MQLREEERYFYNKSFFYCTFITKMRIVIVEGHGFLNYNTTLVYSNSLKKFIAYPVMRIIAKKGNILG